MTYTILTCRGGDFITETGYHDDLQRWIATESRPATDKEILPFKRRGVVSLKMDAILASLEDFNLEDDV